MCVCKKIFVELQYCIVLFAVTKKTNKSNAFKTHAKICLPFKAIKQQSAEPLSLLTCKTIARALISAQ